MNNSIKSLKKTIIIISSILLAIVLLYLYVRVQSVNVISDGGIEVEHESLIRTLDIIAYCFTIFSILALDITLIIVKKNNKKFYYILVGIFSVFILVINIVLSLIGDYIYNDDYKNGRYTSWWSETEQIHPYNP